MKLQQDKNKQGFTLIELLLYLGISSVMVVVVSSVSIGMLRASKKNELLQDVSGSSMYILKTLDYISSVSYAIDYPVVGATSSSVTFRTYDASLDPTVLSYTEGVLLMKQGEGPLVPLHTSNVATQTVFTNTTEVSSSDSLGVSIDVSVSTESILASAQVSEDFQTSLILKFSP